MVLKDQHSARVVVEEASHYFARQESWSEYFSIICLRGGILGLRIQRDGVLGVDILRAALSERSVQVETFWEVSWVLWMAWWGSDGLSLVGELRVCVLVGELARVCVLLRLVLKLGVLMVWCMSFLEGRSRSIYYLVQYGEGSLN